MLPLRSRKTDHDVVQFFPPFQVGSTSSQSRASRNARLCQSVFRCTPHRQPQTRRAESLRCTPLPVYVGPRRSGQSLPPVPAATALRRPDSPVRRSLCQCFYSTVCASSRTPFYLASAASRREPAAAYGLAPYAICVRLQPQLTPSLHPAPNGTGQLMNARFSLCANFNVITRPKDAAGDIYLFFGRSRACARLLSNVIH